MSTTPRHFRPRAHEAFAVEGPLLTILDAVDFDVAQGENVLLPLELAGHPDPGERAEELLELVGLGERGHHYPAQLSGGDQQRVALARAFAGEPEILFADEPTGNLDSATGQNVLHLLEELRRDVGTTMILVTHDPTVAERADRRIHLRDGRQRAGGLPGW